MLGAAPQLLAGVEVARVLDVDGAVPLHTGPLLRGGQRQAFVLGARRAGVAAEGGGAAAGGAEDDQVAHAVAVHHGRESAAALGIAQAQLGVAAGLGAQRGQAVFAEALVQRGRAEGGAQRGRDAPGRRDGVAVGHATGALAAELAVVVVAQVDLHRVAAGTVAVAQRQRVLRAALVDGQARGGERGVVQAVFAALQCGAETVCAQAVFVLPDVAAQAGFRAVERRRGLVAAGRIRDRHARAVGLGPLRRPGQAGGVQAVQVAVVHRAGGLVGEGVIAGVHAAGQQGGVELVAGIDLVAQPGVARGAAVAVAVGVVRAAGLGVKSVAARMGQAQGIVQRLVGPYGAADAGLQLARALAAQAHAHVGRRSTLALAREELDHAADGVRSVHRRSGAAQHFDALDLRQRDLFPLRAAGGLRVHPHSVDIDGREACFGTAHEKAGGIAHTAVARDFDAGQARQHVGNAGGAAGLDGFAVDDGDVGHQVGEGLFGSGGGHHHVLQRGHARVLRQQQGLHGLFCMGCAGGSKGQHGKSAWAQRQSTAHARRGLVHGNTTESESYLRRLPRRQIGDTAAQRLERAQPPCWPVSGLAARSPTPSQALVQGAQWLCVEE